MQKESIAILAYMNANKEKKNNQFTFEDFAPLDFPAKDLRLYCEELERHGDIDINDQYVQPIYSLL